ncbi:hypothetical protein SAMN05443377_10861 [Propionibacterium cyclohexanicum]|uniref:Polysaccharide pyruvyl transferase family protein WcaK n=1 Tax=Propionibacterium cyclohexanicum TaxID=64702 RepID=A0A1H9RNN6_9ACTN|nr:polysaccharide pyruvyl transferase family protein [Propionibacterium cyclohexanicum]SER74316.1 hypothetical protein SAMN05443377_10861 [Propionibacterium cyclohexanicum]
MWGFGHTRKTSRQSPHIYLLATSGHPNYGDEFIVRSWLEFLNRELPMAQVWLDSPNPGLCTQLFSDSHPGLRCTDTLWRLADQVSRHAPVAQWRNELESYLVNLGTPLIDAGIQRLDQMSRVHMLGGGYLNSIWPQNCLLTVAAAALSGNLRIPAVATGLGLEPQSADTAGLLGEAFGAFDFVESRDGSGPVETAFPMATPGFDDAFLGLGPAVEGFWRKPQDRTPPHFMLLIQGDQYGDESSRTDVVETALAELRRAGWAPDEPVGLVEAIPPDDAWALAALREERHLTVEFYPFLDLWNNGLPFAADQYWVSTRFHFHLLAAACGIDGTAVSISGNYYSPKHHSLIELGTGWRLVDAHGATMCEADRTATCSFPRVAGEIAQAKTELARLVAHGYGDRELLREPITALRGRLAGGNQPR